MNDTDLSVEIGSLRLRNPTILAGGILGLTGASLKRVWESGAGGVVTKSIGTKPKKGYPGPNIVQSPYGLLNAMGLPNPGIGDMLREIKIAKRSGATVIASIFGDKPSQFKELASKVTKAQVDAIELNLSCPHAEDLSVIGQNPEFTKEIVRSVKKYKPLIWTKLPGNTHVSNLIEVAESAEKAGADAIVLTNTIPGMAIDAKARRPILGNKKGGLSGRAIKPIVLRLIYEVYEEIKTPIIGTGGVTTGEDMIEYILAGASAVEIGTGTVKRGLNIFEEICEEASLFLKGDIKELIGSAHRD